MYDAKTDAKTQRKVREDLKWLYSQIPETKGCMECINKPFKEGGCGAWCCELQTPQVLYCEFLNTWNYVLHNWTDKEITALIGRCLRSYLFGRREKGCVIWDKQTKLCMQHDTRPYNCRVYGITPDEEFKPRYERLKVIYPHTRPQCDKVSTVSGQPVTVADTTKWWGQLNGIEVQMGVDPKRVNDEPDGSYRTYHDHILLHILGKEGLTSLAQIRQEGDLITKENTYRNVMKAVENFGKTLKTTS
jgi:Fe-S-cluster containining protein